MRDLILYQCYAAKKLLPAHRNAVHLAQIAMFIAKSNGVKNCTIEDFLLRDMDEIEIPEDEAADFFGFNPTVMS